MDKGAWWAAISEVAQSWTRLKRLSSSSTLITQFKDFLIMKVKVKVKSLSRV